MVSIDTADLSVRVLHKRVLYDWIKRVVKSEKRIPQDISIILCSDEYLLDMNRRFLQHDYFTDIITFDYCEEDLVSGELYISLDRVKENAVRFKVTVEEEMHRVMVHGVLHLCGYNDKTKAEAKMMRRRENQKLKMLVL